MLVLADQPAGQQLFSSSCAGCHGLDGRGGEHAPNIATNENVRRLADADLMRIVRNGIPAAGMPAFGSSLKADQVKYIVAFLRVLQGKTQTVKLSGDAAKGRSIFLGRGGCSECHMMDGQGGFLGADLSGYGESHSPDQIRDAILNRGKNSNVRNGAIVVITRSGQKYAGIVRNEDNFSVQMQTRDGAFHFFDKADVARIERPAQSLMPQYGSRLSSSEVDDLIAYLTKSTGTEPLKKDEDDDQ